ncbi:cystatin-2-like [Rhipicephalus microplus]|uniref:cystatin-2-like n=1 Tax=Rhipicephalus microplus TaxID=6941 RepID=UPI003F6C51D0
MVPPRMSPLGIAMFVVATFFLCAAQSTSLKGGWKRKQVGEDAIFDELAHYAVSKQVSDREFFDTVLELVEVETQTVAGTNYRIKFKTAESRCRIGEEYDKEVCLSRNRETVKDTCTAVVYDVPWLNECSLTSFNCEGTRMST